MVTSVLQKQRHRFTFFTILMHFTISSVYSPVQSRKDLRGLSIQLVWTGALERGHVYSVKSKSFNMPIKLVLMFWMVMKNTSQANGALWMCLISIREIFSLWVWWKALSILWWRSESFKYRSYVCRDSKLCLMVLLYGSVELVEIDTNVAVHGTGFRPVTQNWLQTDIFDNHILSQPFSLKDGVKLSF